MAQYSVPGPEEEARGHASRFAMRVILMEFGFPLTALLLSPAQLMLLSVRRELRRRGLLLLRVLLVFQDDIERVASPNKFVLPFSSR